MAGDRQVYQANYVNRQAINQMSAYDQVLFLQGLTLGDSYITKNKTTDLEEEEIEDRAMRMEPFYDEAKKIFCSMFGIPENTEVTASMVQQSMQQMLVDGKSYQKAFKIKDADENNYDFIVCHMVQNVTRGDIAQSFHSGQPKQVVVLGNGLGEVVGLEENSVCRAIVPPPQEIIMPKSPKPLSGWKRFWGVFGLYKKEREQFAQETQIYEAAVAEQMAARERQERQTAAAKTYAANVERTLREKSFSQEAQDKIKAVFQERNIRRELHEAAVEAKKGIHNSEQADMTKLLYYLTNGTKLNEKDIPDKNKDRQAYDEYFSKKASDITSQYTQSGLLTGSGRIGSVLHQITMYMLTFKGVSLEQMTQGIASMKENPISKKGRDFLESMRTATQEYSEIMNVKDKSEVTEEKKQRVAQTVAAMYRKFGEFQMNEIDPLNPADIRQKATQNMMLERLGMDLGQLLGSQSKIAQLINQELEKTETENDRNFGTPLKHCTSVQTAAKAGGIDAVCSLYASQDFKDGKEHQEIKGTYNHLQGVFSRIVISQNACGNIFAGQPMQEYSREVVLGQKGMPMIVDLDEKNAKKLVWGEEVSNNVLQLNQRGLHQMVPNHIEKVKSTLTSNKVRINPQQLEENRPKDRQQSEKKQSTQKEKNQAVPKGMGGK